jgi:aspartyl-tRNA(Asn)/glutamyl-tRNA(Gln) amidotransferase subunit B
MRSKEDAHDYRYFPDPDLPPLLIEEAWIRRIQEDTPESQPAMRSRLVAEHGLSDYDAAQLTADRDIADYYVKTIAAANASEPGSRKQVANWVLGELTGALNKAELGIARAPISPEGLAGLLRRIADKTISGTLAKEIFDAMWEGEGDADTVIENKGLRQISDQAAIEKIVDGAIASNPAIVAEFRAGKEKAFNSLVGKVMAASKGRANPAQVNAILRKKLEQ